MVDYGRSECLSHPLCAKLLDRKWIRYGRLICSVRTCFYLLFLGSLTTIIVTYPSCSSIVDTPKNAHPIANSPHHFYEDVHLAKDPIFVSP